MRTLVILWTSAVLVSLAGCVLDNNSRTDQNVPPPIINVPPSEKLDATELRQGIKDDIVASSNATSSQMTGAVNASISKLAEKVVGLEAAITTSITATANVNTQASAELRAKLEASLTAVAEIRTELKMTNEFNARVESKISLDANLIKDLNAKIDTLNVSLAAQVAGMANGQVGLLNKIDSRLEQVTSTAGRDITYFPKEAVEIIVCIMGVVAVGIGWIGRNARLREKLRTDEEKDERKVLSDLLMETLAMLPESRSKEVRELKDKLANRTRIDIPPEPGK
jgi:cation transporter-like permease